MEITRATRLDCEVRPQDRRRLRVGASTKWSRGSSASMCGSGAPSTMKGRRWAWLRGGGVTQGRPLDSCDGHW